VASALCGAAGRSTRRRLAKLCARHPAAAAVVSSGFGNANLLRYLPSLLECFGSLAKIFYLILLINTPTNNAEQDTRMFVNWLGIPGRTPQLT
jgi:hypothetical protein